ncbi:MAG: hypothetical protein JWR69_4626 [Pedosphaera sp.]|nr:hypothetical protein [Pedosphaera sp.]
MKAESRSVLVKGPPLKWRKYELLSHFELASLAQIESTVRRFPWHDREALLEEVRIFLPMLGESEFCVVKLVLHNAVSWLPNYRIYGPKDLLILTENLMKPGMQFDEIWYCRTNTRHGRFSVGGRILIDRRCGHDGHTIEQVWRCSPRMIEYFDDGFDSPYVRAVRAGWGWRPRIVSTFIPRKSSVAIEELGRDLCSAMALILPLRERLVAFESFIFESGCDVVSIEYKIDGDNVSIIDWDTFQDRAVLYHWDQSV